MGISTYQSYCGAQIFDAVGLKADFVAKYFTGTATRIEGVGLCEIAEETVRRHADAFGEVQIYKTALDVGGEYAYRTRGEEHAWNAEIGRDAAARGARQFAGALQGLRENPQRAVRAAVDAARPVQVQDAPRTRSASPCRSTEVEPAKEIVKRFATGAMSFGSISREAHTTLAIAMNRIGGKSNTGEGGEEADRFKPMAERRFDALGDQAGRLRPVRRDDGISRQLRHDADQDGAGRQARRRRPVARPQGRRDHRARAAFDAGRRPDLAAAASRHLFDRGSRAADLRPQERQSRRATSRSSWSPKSASAPWPRASRRRAPTTSPSPASRAAPARQPADLDQARRLARGKSALPKPTRRWCASGCAAASWCRSTAASAPGATW